MKITLAEEGGWAETGVPRESVVDVDALDEHAAQEGRALAENLIASGPPPPPDRSRARDDTTFTVRIEHDGHSEVRSANSTALSPEFSKLLQWLKRRGIR